MSESVDEVVPLRGGRITEDVVRIGDTVRRPTSAASPFAASLLDLLESRGFTGAPRYLGRDQVGRDTFSFVPGWVPPKFRPWTDVQVAAAGALARAMHDATRGSDLAGQHQVVCHHDLGPNNAVFQDEMPVAFIDFDMAAPGSPLEDVGYMLCKRNVCPSVLCLTDWLASQLPCARGFGGPNSSAGRGHRAVGPAAVHDAAVLVAGRRWSALLGSTCLAPESQLGHQGATDRSAAGASRAARGAGWSRRPSCCRTAATSGHRRNPLISAHGCGFQWQFPRAR
ncbi:phosphotransferase [Streptomyces sp. NPDC001508]|uniref:phosphotransferase family protein n=1 Tax=Streptomyces sp. NPDC001508 TaxID=3154656 RepID=UPI00333301AB